MGAAAAQMMTVSFVTMTCWFRLSDSWLDIGYFSKSASVPDIFPSGVSTESESSTLSPPLPQT